MTDTTDTLTPDQIRYYADRFVTTCDVVNMLDISRRTGNQLVSQKGFPDPVFTFGTTRVWWRPEVEA